MTDTLSKTEYRFEVALSFAGLHRDKVRAIAERLSEAIDPGIDDRSKGRVFFDDWFEHEILGSDMDVLLQSFYHSQSLMVMADVSEQYAERPWTQAEARAIRALRFELNAARDETARLRLLNARFGDGEVPGVFKTEGTLDGIHKSPDECANVILKRRDLLRERLGSRENLAITLAEASEVCPSRKNWVWHSTLATRAADQVSVLAVVETLLAIVLYWWFAFRFDTHCHLVSSVVVAPLLLLRSPESMAAGVRWFLNDWFDFDNYNSWPRRNRLYWLLVMSSITGGFTYCFVIDFSHHWLIGGLGSSVLGQATKTGVVSIWFTAVLAISLATAVSGAGVLRSNSSQNHSAALVGSAAGFVAGAFIAVSPGLAAVWGAVGSLLFFLIVLAATKGAAGVILGSPIAAGIAVRALICRVAATLFNARTGVRRLPENWRETNFLTDLILPAELMPGIRNQNSLFALDGMLKIFFDKRNLATRFLSVFLAIFFFVPAFLYRLNIKATAWFWWPLAYLLKPVTVAGADGEQRQAMCWPWSDPIQRLLIVLSIGLALLSLVLLWLMATSRIESDHVTSLPLAVRVSLGWTRLAPWHWALWIVAAAGAGMLLLAGNACSNHANGNWSQFCQNWPHNIRIMTALCRVRRIATVSLLVMSLGALLLQDGTWPTFIRFPASWMTALERFYQLHP